MNCRPRQREWPWEGSPQLAPHPAPPIRLYQAVTRTASPPLSRSIFAPTQFARTRSSTHNTSQSIGRTQTSTLQAARPQGLSEIRHTPAPNWGPSYGRLSSMRLPQRFDQLQGTLNLGTLSTKTDSISCGVRNEANSVGPTSRHPSPLTVLNSTPAVLLCYSDRLIPGSGH